MRKALAPTLFLAAATLLPAQTAEDASEPLEVDLVEEERVRLVLLDVLVLDRDERTVPDLTAEDFEIVTDGNVRPVDTVDVTCGAAPREDARAVNRSQARDAPAPVPGGRKIVLAIDYLHLEMIRRAEVLEHARKLLDAPSAPDDRWMVVALTGGLRIEQPWTTDTALVRDALRRMERDVTLWNGNFAHLMETGFVSGLEVLFESLGEEPGPKGIVLFSEMGDVPLDSQFRKLAAIAATARCSIYPVDAGGLRDPLSLASGAG